MSQTYVQFLRAAGTHRFEIIAYCFMPDHLHFASHGTSEHSDCKAFIKAAKQYSGYAFKQRHDQRLWQRYGFERVIRDDAELASTIGYIISNPVRAGLVTHPSQYPHLGSQIYSVAELLKICEYRAESADLPPEGGSHDVLIMNPELPPKGGGHDVPPSRREVGHAATRPCSFRL